MLALSHPVKQDWKPTGIKGERYEIYKNGDGIISLFLDGKIIPHQKDLSYYQKMDDVITIKLKIILG